MEAAKKNEWNDRLNEKSHEIAEKGKTVVDRAIQQVKNIDPEDVRRSAAEIGERLRDASSDVYDNTVGFVRRNPVGSAVGLCAFGFLVGYISAAMKKSA
jgi:hypothetical protein